MYGRTPHLILNPEPWHGATGTVKTEKHGSWLNNLPLGKVAQQALLLPSWMEFISLGARER